MTDIGRAGMVMKGDYNSASTYETLDAVSYQNGLYIAKQNVPAGIEPTNTTYWQCAVESRDRILEYEQRDMNITLSFSGSVTTRHACGLLFVCGQSGITETIAFMFTGSGEYEDITNRDVCVSPNSFNITAGNQCINIPSNIGNSWGYIIIREIGNALKDITITATYT